MTSEKKECAICYEDVDEAVICKCKTSLCTGCFKDYTDSCYKEKGKLPKCVVCPREYLIECFDTYESALEYSNVLFRFIKINPDFQTMVNTVTKEKRIISRLRKQKAEFFEKLPSALKYVINLTMMDKYKKAMEINMEFVDSQTAKRKCFSGVCPTGNLDQNPDGDWLCDTCQNVFCRRCEHIMFENHQCKKEDLDSIGFIASLVHCPSCNAPVQKESGCSNLTCALCGTKFREDTGEVGGYGGHDDVIKRKDTEYSLVSELDGKYPREIIKTIRAYESKMPDLPILDEITEYLEEDELSEDQVLELFESYSNFKNAQYLRKEFFKTILEIRQLHIDENLTIENLKKIIG